MIWALKDNEKIQATPKDRANCPICSEEVIAKCGFIKVWHWSHKSNIECDNWYETETEWHKSWKDNFPKEQQEFTMGRHRADIRTSSRYIIELQNSSISSEEIFEREEYYKRMIWLLNGENLAKGFILRKKDKLFTFRWKNPPKSWWFATKPIYIHFCGTFNFGFGGKVTGDYIFELKKIYTKIPCGGYGNILNKQEFLEKYK